ncbi:2'-5' RNA ligase family protein [Jatrophihabitans sp.]|uniref:2'-5' RNA ligase family protein n=1 Tax=Jatrophihabitans sp. TaxID=1932789 RepID=UPI002CCFE9EC|nr:2'-5' RNA ligase family protein [Jatrophihabitans sp.]
MAVGELSLWLQPEPAAAAELDAVIARLAAVHGTAPFPSHLTLLGVLDQDPDTAVAALAELAEAAGPVRVRFGETRCEPAWHRSLYLVAVPEPALRRLAGQAAQAFEVSGSPAFEPHLSLQYSELPVADKLRLAAQVELRLPLSVRFDRLSLWQTPGSDARRWRLVAEHRLTAHRRAP